METEYSEAKEQRQGKLGGGAKEPQGLRGQCPQRGSRGQRPKLKPFYAKIVIESLPEHVFPH